MIVDDVLGHFFVVIAHWDAISEAFFSYSSNWVPDSNRTRKTVQVQIVAEVVFDEIFKL